MKFDKPSISHTNMEQFDEQLKLLDRKLLQLEEGADIGKIREFIHSIEEHPSSNIHAAQAGQTISVDAERLAQLQHVASELMVGSTRLNDVNERLRQEIADSCGQGVLQQLNEVTARISLTISALQEGVVKTRLLPLQRLFRRYPRFVRDISRKLNKEIDFLMVGEHTELDREMIDKIDEPLVSLLCKAAVHNIESAEERQKAGKPRKGTLLMKASRLDNEVEIVIADDGKGCGSQDIDTVQAQIRQLQGRLDIDETPGKGTTMTIRLPLSSATVRALLVRLGAEVYAMPLQQVVEIVRLRPDEISTVQGRDVCVIRETVLPLVHLRRALKIVAKPECETNARMLRIVIAEAEGRRVALAVDETLGTREMIVQPLGEYWADVPFVSGSTIMGDGKVAFILDMASISAEGGA